MPEDTSDFLKNKHKKKGNKKMKVLLLHCVNHSMFGKRDPKQYGTITLEGVNAKTKKVADELGVELETFVTNFEGEIVEKIHDAYNTMADPDRTKIDAILINAGAWTHYSWALHDALHMFADDCGPVYELHMSNTHKREEWRHFSVISPLAQGILIGMGSDVYTLGLRAAHSFLSGESDKV